MYKIVILSYNADNLIPCVRSILQHEPELDTNRIVVVDNGARRRAEPHLPPLIWVTGAKPFVFACNANLGIAAANADVILLNDDTMLMTPGGFSSLCKVVDSTIGICSAVITGRCGNHNQMPQNATSVRLEGASLAFIAVYIPLAVYLKLGPLDERFTGYGYEDNDYCNRARQAGYKLAIYDKCVVDHSGMPCYIHQSNYINLWQYNRELYNKKYGIPNY